MNINFFLLKLMQIQIFHSLNTFFYKLRFYYKYKAIQNFNSYVFINIFYDKKAIDKKIIINSLVSFYREVFTLFIQFKFSLKL